LSKSPIFIATAIVVFISFLNAVDGIIVRILTNDLHPFLIVFYRSVFGLIIIFPLFINNKKVFVSSYKCLHFVRAFLKICALTSFFLAIKSIVLADVTAISFITPILIILGSVIFLKEKPNKSHLILAFIGFSGILFILKPGQSFVSWAIYWAVLGAILGASIQLILKKMSSKDSAHTLIVWNLLCTVPLAFIPACFFWVTPSFGMLLLLSLQGLIGVLNMILMTKAMTISDVSYLAPYDFLRLPIISVLAFLFFDEIPEFSTLIGALIIFFSSFLISNLARKTK
jgi:drug/metabolite transporter (DMT)-like permease